MPLSAARELPAPEESEGAGVGGSAKPAKGPRQHGRDERPMMARRGGRAALRHGRAGWRGGLR
eukprot:8547573-Alexandrium_andersonii.AAC.1